MSSRGNLEDKDHLLGARSNGGCDEALVENVNIHQPQVTASGSTPGDIEMQHLEVTLSSENSQAQDSPAGQFMRSMGRRLRAIDLLPRCPNGPVGDIDKKMLEAAMSGDIQLLRTTCSRNPESLFQTTPQGNNCLHIAAIHGHLMFFTSAWQLQKPLVLAVNSNGQTALMVAVIHGFPGIVTHTVPLLRGQLVLAEALLVADDAGYNVLHHAIRCGYQDLALELIVEAPELSKARSKMNESPMYIATLKNYKEIFEQLICISDSADCGQHGNNALHAAVRNGNEDIVKTIMEHRPSMAKVENSVGISPVRLSVIIGRTEVLRVFLKTDFLLGYEISDAGLPLLVSAACHGTIDVAKELLLYCPDAPYEDSTTGVTCLHEAIISEHEEFLNFIIGAPQLRALINLRDDNGKTALHHAVLKCRPKLVESILSHKDIDISILDEEGHTAAWELRYAYSEAKTLEWNEICMLLSKADPLDGFSIQFLEKEARINTVNASRLDSKALSKTYTSNTAIIATLIATITFAASFTVPGGYSSDPGSAGQTVYSRSQIAFLISNAVALFSSFLVAFLCVLYRWGDYRFLVHYKAVTKLLIWVAYASTLVAFIIGMFIYLAPHHLWLAILILCCGALVPLATKLVGEWPVLMLMLKSRLGRGPSTYRGQLLDIV